ncbi:hypothetical protein [Alkalihalobacillus sp. AL-G]|nr:hypothetical protein [Alkalihalobacillus sp. AL-G]WLD91533.1 hypothetical protein MOJ78_10780 [Alkalihalobacillus sp. AL-G]
MKKLPIEGKVIRITEDRIIAKQGEQIFTYNRSYYELTPQAFHTYTA